MVSLRKLPVFRLPEDVLREIARNMNYLQLVALSLLSKKCKTLVKSLHLSCYSFQLLTDTFTINLVPTRGDRRIEFRLELVGGDYKDLSETPREVRVVRGRKEGFRWVNQGGLNLLQLITHLQYIFAHANRTEAIFSGNGVFDLESFRACRLNLTHLVIENVYTDEDTMRAQQILKIFGSKAKNLTLHDCDPIRAPYTVQHLGIQNFNKLTCLKLHSVTLDDLLVFNARHVRLGKPAKMRASHLNRFFNCCIRGVNPRLTYLTFPRPDDSYTVHRLLKGIPYQVFRGRRLHEAGTVVGGVDFRSEKGKLATLLLVDTFLLFYVWH